jgi:hypothetical protein
MNPKLTQKEQEFIADEIERCQSLLSKSWWAVHILEAIQRYAKRAHGVSAGRNRITFLFPTYVIKVPRDGYGNADNEHEGCMGRYAITNRKRNRGVPVARTRFIAVDHIYIIAMERVNLLGWTGVVDHYAGDYPSWVDGIDCGQVGLTRSGELVAYDYGIH